MLFAFAAEIPPRAFVKCDNFPAFANRQIKSGKEAVFFLNYVKIIQNIKTIATKGFDCHADSRIFWRN